MPSITAEPIDAYVGSRIRARRKMVSVSQSELGRHLGVTFQQIQKYEKGLNRVAAGRLRMIASFLDVPMSFFFEGGPDMEAQAQNAGNEEAPSPIKAHPDAAEGLELARLFMGIKDPKKRRLIIDLAKAVTDVQV